VTLQDSPEELGSTEATNMPVRQPVPETAVYWQWPATAAELINEQLALAVAADAVLATDPWLLAPAWGQGRGPLLGGCFVAFARGQAGPGHAGDRAWAAAVTWRPPASRPAHVDRERHPDRALVGSGPGGPRRADDVDDQAVISGEAGAGYLSGLLALREGALLSAAVGSLRRQPELLLVDATGRDHQRRAGMAVHLGALTGLPTVGVTHRPLWAEGSPPAFERGATSSLTIAGEEVGRWVCTRSGARPVVAHAGWRTDAATAAAVVLAASTNAARAPVPLGEARRVAREARAIAEGRAPRR
jgi:deoxyribonuclease V